MKRVFSVFQLTNAMFWGSLTCIVYVANEIVKMGRWEWALALDISGVLMFLAGVCWVPTQENPRAAQGKEGKE